MIRHDPRHQMAVHVSACLAAALFLVCPLGVSRGYAGEPSGAPSAHAEDPNDVASRFQHIGDTVDQMEPAVSAAREMIRLLLDSIQKWADPALRETLRKLTEEREVLQKQHEQLDQQVTELKRALESRQNDMPDQSRAELEQKLAKAMQEKEELEKKVKELSSQGNMLMYQKFSKKPQYVLIYRGRVAPMKEPYYAISRRGTIQGSGLPGVEIKRVKDGEPVDQAISPGGCLDRILSALGPNECISFQVCADSITAFRTLVEHVRTRKIAYTWEPEEDRAFIFSAGGGGGHDIIGENFPR